MSEHVSLDRTSIRRAIAVLVAVLAFQCVFALSYVGAFHDPHADELQIGVVAPSAEVGAAVAAQLAAADPTLDPQLVADETTARDQLLNQDLSAALIVGLKEDRLLTVSASSPSIAQSLVSGLTAAEQGLGRTLTVEDVAPLPQEDSRGLVPFYLVLALVVGGYLGATVLTLAGGPFVRSSRHALARSAALIGYAVVSGIVVTAMVAAAFDVLSGHLLAVAAAGALTVASVALASAAFQAHLGMAGTAAVLVLFVAIGNPASGGPAARPLLPGFFATVGRWLPNGAATDLVRSITYLDAHALAQPLLVLVGWGVAGFVALLLARRVRSSGSASAAIVEAEAAAVVAAG